MREQIFKSFIYLLVIFISIYYIQKGDFHFLGRPTDMTKIKVGDLVRLTDDHDLDVGVGVVLKMKKDCKKINDLLIVEEDDEEGSLITEEIPEFSLFNPIYLILWQGDNISPNDRPVWMFRSEIELVKKNHRKS